MSVYLAVNADDAKTECVLADDECVLSRVSGEPVTLTQVDGPEASARLRNVLEQAGALAGVPLYLVTRACVGLARVATESVRRWAEFTLSEVLTGELLLVGVEDLAFNAAFGNKPGVLVCAGTGSSVVGRCGNGSRFAAGGWGPVLGDEGSGHWIGREGMRSGLRALDRGLPTCLLREIHGLWGTQNVGALVSKANSRPQPDFALLTEAVARCATQGDALARSVLERAGEELAAQVGIVISKMRSASCAPGDVRRIAFTGDVLTRIQPVRHAMVAALQLTHPGSRVDEHGADPIEGALAHARRQI